MSFSILRRLDFNICPVERGIMRREVFKLAPERHGLSGFTLVMANKVSVLFQKFHEFIRMWPLVNTHHREKDIARFRAVGRRRYLFLQQYDRPPDAKR